MTKKLETVPAIKGFNKDWTCRDFQFEIGRTYTHNGPVIRCAAAGFHSVDGNPMDAFTYYSPAKSVFGEVVASGEIARETNGDSKIASAIIHIEAEIKLPAIIKRAAEWVIKAAKGNMATGDSGHAAATGDRGHAAATGDRGHAAATGYRGHAAATGDSGHAAATGYRGHAAATGCSSHAAATGDRGHAAATGYRGVAVSLGYNGTAMAGPSGWIVMAYCSPLFPYPVERIERFKVGEDGVEAGKVYCLSADGRPVEVVS